MATIKTKQIKFIGSDIFRFGIPDSAAARGQDLDIDSELESEMLQWANETVTKLKTSALDKGFLQSGRLVQEIGVGAIVKGNQLYTLEINLADHWRYAEFGRGPTKNKTSDGQSKLIPAIIQWIGKHPTVQAKFFNEPKFRGKVNPIYKLARTNRKKAFESSAFVISRAIHKKGTIKRFSYKGSNFIGSVMNKTYLENFSKRIAEKTGVEISIYLSEL